MTIIMN